MGRFGALCGQISDFCGNDGETSAVFTGAGSLDGCIEGQYICLEGNIFNCADNFTYLVGALSDVLHSRQHLLHAAIAYLGFIYHRSYAHIGF